jgi:hypothetical protein
MVGDDAANDFAADTSVPSYMRLMLACFARANVKGHCAFRPGEMKRLLAGRDGELAQRSSTRYALGRLKAWGVIAPESTTRCVVLDSRLYQRADNRHWVCSEPGHKDLKWVNGLGWEDEPGDWDGWLQRAEARELILAQLRPGG